MKRYGRVDQIHKSMREYFRAHGCEWEDTSGVGKGFPDAIVGARFLIAHAPIIVEGVITGFRRHLHKQAGRMALIEIKSGAKARTKPATAKKQADFAARFPVWRVATIADADEVIAWLKS